MNTEATANLNAANEAKYQASQALNAVSGGYDITPLIEPYRVAWEEHPMNIESLFIPEKVRYIGGEIFRGSHMQSLSIPANIIGIDDYAFESCEELKHLVIEEGEDVVMLSSGAFYGCLSLEHLEIKRLFELVGDDAFAGIPETCEILLPTLTIHELLSYTSVDILNYNGFLPGMVFHCKDGDYVLESI